VKLAARFLPHRSARTLTPIRLILALGVLAACAKLRLPDQPPAGPNSSEPAPTPTLASVLLTPVATLTLLPTLDPAQATPTPTFGLPLPEPTCEATPMWGLGDVWSNEQVRTRLGCLLDEQIGIQGEELYFQSGHMVYRPDLGLIYVLFNGYQESEGWGAFVDTFQPSDPDTDPLVVEPTPMPGPGGKIYSQPAGRFGKLWRENSWLRDKLGWARVTYDGQGQALSKIPFNGVVQDFQRGVLLWSGDVCFVLRTDDMSWLLY
jgi:hypothetical protein